MAEKNIGYGVFSTGLQAASTGASIGSVFSPVVGTAIGAGVGLIAGGLMQKLWTVIADMVTRFSGFVIGSIMTGVIWISQPESFVDVLLYDNLHVFLWFGGLFFALRGNRVK